MQPLQVSNVSCRYGSPMGRPNILPDDRDEAVKLQMTRLRWVDGDYDEGGAYWGGGKGTTPVYFASGDSDEGIIVEVYVRATSRKNAKAEVRKRLPNAKFYR